MYQGVGSESDAEVVQEHERRRYVRSSSADSPYPLEHTCRTVDLQEIADVLVGVRAGTARSSLASSQRPAAPCARIMLFASFFKTLVGKQITVELKNDLAIVGTLHSVDQVRPSPARCACSASWR